MTVPIVIVKWIDAETSDGWDNDHDDNEPVCYSVGFLVKETEKFLTLAGSFSEGQTNNRIKIPKGMIVAVMPLKQDYKRIKWPIISQ